MLELLTPTPVPLHPEQYSLTRTLTGLTTLTSSSPAWIPCSIGFGRSP